MGHDTVMSNLRLVARISVSLLAVLLAWLGFLFTRSRGVLADMIVIISLAWILSRLLVFVLGRRWGYRSAFVIAVGAALAGETASFLRSNTFVGWWWLALVFLSGFAGGLLATVMDTGLWEDNFPPSAEILDEVFLFHKNHLGKLKKFLPQSVPLISWLLWRGSFFNADMADGRVFHLVRGSRPSFFYKKLCGARRT